MIDLVDEIQEDIKKENIEQVWKKYKYFLVFMVVAFLLGAGLFIWWQGEQEKIAQLHGSSYYNIMDVADNEDSDTKAVGMEEHIANIDAVLPDYNGDKKAMFLFKKASLFVSESKFDEARSVYELIYQDTSTSKNIREYAQLLHASFAKGSDQVQEAISNIDAILLTSNKTDWRVIALRIKAILLLRNYQNLEAQEIYEALEKDPAATASVKEISSNMAEYLGAGVPAEIIRRYKETSNDEVLEFKGSKIPAEDIKLNEVTPKTSEVQEIE